MGRFKVQKATVAISRWTQVHTPEGELVAEWVLDNPYTGPARACDVTDEWVHYPNGALKIRYTRRESRPALDTNPAPDWATEVLTTPEGETRYRAKYGVRYVLPAELFRDPVMAQAFVSEKVAEFIENRDTYFIPANGMYHQGE